LTSGLTAESDLTLERMYEEEGRGEVQVNSFEEKGRDSFDPTFVRGHLGKELE